MTPRIGIEGRNAYQAMDARLGLQVAVGIGAVHLQGDALDPALRFQDVEDVDRVPVPFRPPGIHAIEHAHPVAGLRSACPRVDGDECGGGVIVAAEKLENLQLAEALFEALPCRTSSASRDSSFSSTASCQISSGRRNPCAASPTARSVVSGISAAQGPRPPFPCPARNPGARSASRSPRSDFFRDSGSKPPPCFFDLGTEGMEFRFKLA